MVLCGDGMGSEDCELCGPWHGHGLLELWLLTAVQGCLMSFQGQAASG